MAKKPSTQSSNNAAASNAESANQQQFVIQKVYLKDGSLETPGTPEVFTQSWKPEAKVELNTRRNAIGDNLYEVIVTVTVTATMEEKTAYLCEVHQAGVFNVVGFDETTTDQLLGAYCPGVLFPYAREAVTDLTAKAGFPPMTLSPVNFDALYARRRQQAAEGTSAQAQGEQADTKPDAASD
ncbi:MAG: protein-export chaperone SecB [Spiribacter sp.]|jgi:preprotein translocase subunit SecB|nr:protein-export chaperone SecB [Spiribacter sp.]MDR9489359.1 protein-export chaperone SecB [Spiribacter sp.]